jgi:assimilatory nitrate reductase electron transfer subunit
MSTRRIVVIGNGMAGARLVERVRDIDPCGDRVALTVVGAEAHPAYNRVLLSKVLAGAMDVNSLWLQEPGWANEHRVTLRLGCAATRIDRWNRLVVTEDGSEIEYDELVLATGAVPWLPPIDGLMEADGRRAPGVRTLRGLDECEDLLASVGTGAPVVVLGGGLLGLEAARGLAGRGHPVTVVHPVAHVMERQLDSGAGAVLRESLRDKGIEFRLSTSAAGYIPGDGIKLEDGFVVPADVVVVCTGVRPDTALADAAGLAVDGGVVVDDSLRSSDPRIRAIGDCATYPGTVGGLVDPAWDQAEVLANLLTGNDISSRYRGSTVVTRLKADGIDLCSVGDPLEDDGAEMLRVEDGTRGRYAKLVVRQGKVAGAIVIGLPDAAAEITQLFDRGLEVPQDRMSLLLGRAVGAAAPTGPAELAEDALVCRCNSVSKGDLVRSWQAGASSSAELSDRTRAATGCGGCRGKLEQIAEWLEREEELAKN